MMAYSQLVTLAAFALEQLQRPPHRLHDTGVDVFAALEICAGAKFAQETFGWPPLVSKAATGFLDAGIVDETERRVEVVFDMRQPGAASESRLGRHAQPEAVSAIVPGRTFGVALLRPAADGDATQPR